MNSRHIRQNDKPIGQSDYESAIAASEGTAKSSGHTYAEPKTFGTYAGSEGESGKAGAAKENEHSGKHEEKAKKKSGTKGHLGGKGNASAEWSSSHANRSVPGSQK